MGGSRGDDGPERPTRRDSRPLQALYPTRPESNPIDSARIPHRFPSLTSVCAVVLHTPPPATRPPVPHLRSHWPHPPLLHVAYGPQEPCARHLRMTAKDSDSSYHISNEAFTKVIVLDESPVQARTPQSSSSKGVADDLRADVKWKKGALVSGAVPNPSLVDASWRVPGRGLEEHPGFHVDYAEPRTHPPSHN
ncbi:hypothetical protein MUK42_29706 [Musa troglodytarum]|uniref:Uncharacterized protein n=1 Tax=Musa troglodytarum TaxID=320322 RepID=A0A9E7JYJ9_9LILI|nr:hypothetical protein MUK42_29706 [Musa troglodytarum]